MTESAKENGWGWVVDGGSTGVRPGYYSPKCRCPECRAYDAPVETGIYAPDYFIRTPQDILSEWERDMEDLRAVRYVDIEEVEPGVFSTTPSEVRYTDPVTGGQKGEKPEAYALIPVSALAEVAKVYGYGAKKYDPNNWRKGYPWSLSYSALQRHLNAFWSGEVFDAESRLPHLAHAAFHIFTLMTYWEEELGTDDRAV